MFGQENIFCEGIHLDAASIPKDYRNAYNLKHCLTVANFVGNSGDIAVLKKDKYMYSLIVIVSNVRFSASKKKLEW